MKQSYRLVLFCYMVWKFWSALHHPTSRLAVLNEDGDVLVVLQHHRVLQTLTHRIGMIKGA